MADAEIRSALDRHWAASNAGDDEGEGDIYRDDIELEYPQSIGNASGAVATCSSHADITRRGVGSKFGELSAPAVTEYVIFYDGRPVPTVSILEFRDGKAAHETQYFADPFEAPPWRARWRETKL
jgi:hypothetical protein